MLCRKSLKYLIIVLIIFCSISLKTTSNSNLSQIYLERAKLFYEMGSTNEAVEECEKILVSQPDNDEAQSMITEIKSKYKDSETPYILFLCEFGPQGFQDGELSTSTTLTVDDKDNVYVADRYNHNIQKFNSRGNLLLTFSRERNKRDNFFRPIDSV